MFFRAAGPTQLSCSVLVSAPVSILRVYLDNTQCLQLLVATQPPTRQPMRSHLPRLVLPAHNSGVHFLDVAIAPCHMLATPWCLLIVAAGCTNTHLPGISAAFACQRVAHCVSRRQSSPPPSDLRPVVLVCEMRPCPTMRSTWLMVTQHSCWRRSIQCS